MVGLFFEGRPKFTMNLIVLALSIVQAVLLLMAATMAFGFSGVYQFFTTGIPNPSACGPLFVVWITVLVLYWKGIVKSPKLSTVVAAVFVYFGTAVLFAQFTGRLDLGGGGVEYIWATSVHVMEAYIGYAYFIESVAGKYKLW
jgi:hypothetical protein